MQTDRYKQLLLKQRDIMIQLTARINERDQSVSCAPPLAAAIVRIMRLRVQTRD